MSVRDSWHSPNRSRLAALIATALLLGAAVESRPPAGSGPERLPLDVRGSDVQERTTFAAGATTPTLATASVPAGEFAAYLGTELDDRIIDVEADALGNVYVFGAAPGNAAQFSIAPTDFFGPQPVLNPELCYVAKFVADGNGGLTAGWLALLHDSRRCDAMTVTPDGEVLVARRSGNPGALIERFADVSGSVSRTQQSVIPQLAIVARLRVDVFGAIHAIGECANESFDGELWPLPGEGFQPGPAGLSAGCEDNSLPGEPGGQHLYIAAAADGTPFYGSFVGFSTDQIEPTGLEVDSNGLAYIAGHTNVGPGNTIITTASAFQSQPGDSTCAQNQPGCQPGDAFLIVVDPRSPGPPPTNSLRYASYVGGIGREHDVDLALEGDGLVHLFGNTQSPDTFPGLHFVDPAAVFQIVLDINQPPSVQRVRTEAIVTGGTRLLYAHESRERARLRPDGTAALLLFSDNPEFPLVDPLYGDPRDPNAGGDVNPLLVVHDPSQHALVLATWLDNANLAHAAHLAPAPDGSLYVALLTTEQGRATSGMSPSGGDEVLLLGITAIGVGAPNSPPVADAGEDQTFDSASPVGTTVLLYGGSSFDPDGDVLSYLWTEGTTTLGTDPLIETFLTTGAHAITLTVDDGRGGTSSETITVHIVPNTPAGGALTVTPPDAGWVRASIYNQFPMTIHFAEVTSTGFTSVTSRYELPPVPPPGMQFGSPPLVYDLATTAGFTGPLSVCVDYRGMSFATPDADVRLYKRDNGGWVQLPQTNDTSSRSVCGATDSMGTFALFTPAGPANEISLLAGRPVRSSSCTLDAGLDPNDGGFATDSFLCSARGLAYDAARNYLYFAEAGAGDKIRRVDLATNRITTVAGTGYLPGTFDGSGGDLRDDDQDNVDPLTAPVNQVLALVVDPAGNLLVGEYGAGRIRKIDFAQNTIFTVRTLGDIFQPSTMALDASGALLWASFAGGGGYHIWRLTPGVDGEIDGSADETLQIVAGNGECCLLSTAFPPEGLDPRHIPVPASAIAFAADGSLYATGSLGVGFVLRITPGPDGLIDGVDDAAFAVAGTQFGGGPGLGDGNAAAGAQLYLPMSLAVASNGDVYVGTTGNPWGAIVRRIRAVDGLVTGAPDEIISTIGGFHIFDPTVMSGEQLPYSDGDGHALSAIFGAAFDMVVLPDGDLLVADFYQVRSFGPPSVSTGDITPPVLTLPGAIIAEAESPTGALVTYTATATDGVDGVVSVICSPASGSMFAFNGSSPTSTQVTCSATDAAGNPATGGFTVTVQDTTAPIVSPPAHILVAATEATGARANVPQAPDTPLLLAFLAGGTATDVADANPVRVSTGHVDCSVPTVSLGTIDEATLFSVGANCVELVFRDGSGSVGRAIATFDVAPPIGGHVNQAGVAVVATDTANVPQPVTTTFVALQQPGLVVATPITPGVPPPAGVTFVGTPFDIRSTALAPPAVTVCLQQPGVQADDVLFLLENGAWVERTASVDVSTSQVCGQPTSLGVFAIGRRPVVVIAIDETVTVSDTPGVLPAVMIGVNELVTVSDAPALLPSTLISITEHVTVADGSGLGVQTPAGSLTLTLDPLTATTGLSTTQTVTAVVSDGSDERTRVALTALAASVRVAFVDPGTPDALLSVSTVSGNPLGGSDIVVSLATDSAGAVTSTAAQVALVMNAGPSASLVTAQTWPGSPGDGIVAPRALEPLSDVVLTFTGPTSMTTTCVISAPGFCTITYGATQPGTTTIEAFVDANTNTVLDAGEPSATAQNTWLDDTPPLLTLPTSLTAPATDASGASVAFVVSAVDDIDGPLSPTCSHGSPGQFAIGTTTVTCAVTDAGGNTASGSFTVTVNVGAPSLQIAVASFGRDTTGSFWIDLRVSNRGTGHARNVAIGTLTFRTLTGSGTVTYDAARSGSLPLVVNGLDAGAVQTVRVYLNLPTTVRRFSMSEAGTLEDVLGARRAFSASQAIIP